ncbi:MAG: S8 family peptidase [Pseudomonadota bacterium]
MFSMWPNMRGFILGALICLLQLCPALAWAAPEQVVADQYIIQRDSGAGSGKSSSSAGGSSTSSFEVVKVPNKSQLAGQEDTDKAEDLDWSKVEADCKEIRKDPSVVSCEPDLIRMPSVLPNDPGLDLQWWVYDDVVSTKADFDLSAAWDRGTGSKSVLIGVIDTGVHYTHPELAPNMWDNPADPSDGIDNDGNGYIDDKLGVNTYRKDNAPFDCSGHGTHVAGIMGAKGNDGLGIVGVNWTTSIIAVSAQRCGASGFTNSAIIAGYDYFYDLKRRGHNIRAINASFGGKTPSDIEAAAIARLASVDIVLVAAAGNDSVNSDLTPSYPANYELGNIVSVGATNWIRKLAKYSNYGQSVDIAAPGGETYYEPAGVLSTWSPLAEKDTYYKFAQGTSMAAPMVTGTLGLIASQRPYLNGAHLKSLLFSSADSRPELAGLINGAKFINAARMSVIADPPDNCPADPNKLDPAVCGCGVAESYVDADGDGLLSCLDGCPADAAKTVPGACGCGIPDLDQNKNGRIDCLEVGNSTPGPLNVVLSKPSLKVSGKKLVIGMQKVAGVRYIAEVSYLSKDKKKAPKIKLYTSANNTIQIGKPQRGAKISVRYFARVVSSGAQSGWSPAKTMSVK